MAEIVQENDNRVELFRLVFVWHDMDIFLRVNYTSLVHRQDLDYTANNPSAGIANVRAGNLTNDYHIVQMMLEVLSSSLVENLVKQFL